LTEIRTGFSLTLTPLNRLISAVKLYILPKCSQSGHVPKISLLLEQLLDFSYSVGGHIS